MSLTTGWYAKNAYVIVTDLDCLAYSDMQKTHTACFSDANTQKHGMICEKCIRDYFRSWLPRIEWYAKNAYGMQYWHKYPLESCHMRKMHTSLIRIVVIPNQGVCKKRIRDWFNKRLMETGAQWWASAWRIEPLIELLFAPTFPRQKERVAKAWPPEAEGCQNVSAFCVRGARPNMQKKGQ